MGFCGEHIDMNRDEHDKDLKRVVRLTVSGYRWIVVSVILTTTIATILAVTTRNVYRAYTVLAPASSGESGGLLKSVLGQAGGLASLIDINAKDNDPTTEAIAVLQSRKFIQDFIVERNLLPEIARNGFQGEFGHWLPGASRAPTLWRGYDYFKKHILDVEKDKSTPLVTVRIDWSNREEAADWANDLVRRLNMQMRDRAIAEAEKSISYLNVELDKTSVLPLRESIYKLIENDIKQKTIANVRNDYVFRVVDPALVPDAKEKVKPYRAVYVITGVLSGFLLGVFALLMSDFAQRAMVWFRRGQ
jgi:uncharacterized protein involved in exopolysaccharide biosynthesis